MVQLQEDGCKYRYGIVCLHAEIVVIILISARQTFQLFHTDRQIKRWQTDEMRLQSISSTAVPTQLNHDVAGNNSLISFRETWSPDSKYELRRHTDAHTITWHIIFCFFLQKKQKFGINLKFVTPIYIFYI